MKVLHFCLGVPPLRSGGLTKYVVDIAVKQAMDRKFEKVGIVYPGRYRLFNRQVHIRDRISGTGIILYEIINPTPVGLLDGTNFPQLEIENLEEEKKIDELFKLFKPDIVHIHNFMGFSSKIVDIAKSYNAKVLFTAHDYQPLCPKVNLFDYTNNICVDYNNGMKCINCNKNAPNRLKCFVRDSWFGIWTKKRNKIKKILLDVNNWTKNTRDSCPTNAFSNNDDYIMKSQLYLKRREAFITALNKVDMALFASSMVYNEYKNYGFSGNYFITPFSHADLDRISCKRKEAIVDETIVFGFMGGNSPAKGLELLLEALSIVAKKGYTNWKLRLIGTSIPKGNVHFPRSNIEEISRYPYSQLNSILDTVNCLIIPSIWKETFSFLCLEAYKKGIPAIISDTVGFTEYIADGSTGIVFHSGDKEALAEKISEILMQPNILNVINGNILSKQISDANFENHYAKIVGLYRELCGS